MEWGIEVAKQVPALGVLCWLVYYFLQDRAKEAQKSEERLIAVIKEKDELAKAVQQTLATSNTTLGGIAVLLTLVEKDLKEAKRATRA